MTWNACTGKYFFLIKKYCTLCLKKQSTTSIRSESIQVNKTNFQVEPFVIISSSGATIDGQTDISRQKRQK